MAENLFNEAVNAKSYLQIIKQFRENSDNFSQEINCSPAFYNVIYNSLIESLFLNLFKLYDKDPSSLTVPKLLSKMREVGEDDLNDYVLEKYKEKGNKFSYRLNEEEELQFLEEVERTKNLCNQVGVTYTHTTVYLTLQNVVDLYAVRYRPLKKKVVENLRNRRIKIGVHNDSKTNFDYKRINNEFPITDDEIESLVEFAIEFLQFCIEVLTGVRKIPEYLNINDWRITLNLVRNGMNYRKTSN